MSYIFKCRVLAILISGALCQRSHAQGDREGLRTQIIASTDGLVKTLERAKFDCRVEVVAFDRVARDWKANIVWTGDADRVLVQLEGNDVLRLADVAKRGPLDRNYSRLFLPGGWMEQKDHVDSSLMLEQGKYHDARTVSWSCLPPDALWLLGSGLKQRVVAAKQFDIALVEGETPNRSVTMTGVTPISNGYLVHYTFKFREDWDWLTSEWSARVRPPEGPEILLLTQAYKVHSVHRSPLSCTPELWEYIDWQCRMPGQERDTLPYCHWKVCMSPPEFDFNSLPDHVDERVSACSGDQMLDGSSFISHTKIMGRGQALVRLASMIDRLGMKRGVGVSRSELLPWILLGLVALGASWIGYSGKARRSYGLAIAILGVGLCALFGNELGLVSALSKPIAWEQVSEGDSNMDSRFLCGPDSLFLATCLDGRQTDYPELMRYVRPGMDGATLAQLIIAAECLGYQGSVTNSRDWVVPPSPCIVHINGNHFAVLVMDVSGRSCLCDPVNGVRRADWSDLQGCVDLIFTLKS